MKKMIVILLAAALALALTGCTAAGREQAEKDTPKAYILHVTDQNGDPVAEVSVNFCTDAFCVPKTSGKNGLITFIGAPDVYHVQIIDVPDGYSFDESFELYAGPEYGEWPLQVKKN